MAIRTMSALIGAPLLLGFSYLGGKYTAFLVALLALLALREFLHLGEKMGIKAWYGLTLTMAGIWLAIVFWGERNWLLPTLILWLLISFARMALQYPRVQLAEASYNFLAPVYSVVLFSHLYLLRMLPHGLEWTFVTFLLVWATDTFAYLIGRQFGRHLLAPNVSPNKTIEGSIGGLMGSIGMGLLLWYRFPGVPLVAFLGLAGVVGISAQIGDLFESALKRSAGVKDSGRLIPGHGGILDRFDSFIFVLPLVYFWVLSFVQ